MKKTILTAIVVSGFLLFLTHVPINCQATAESTSYINFDSGITIFSPLNTTYYSEPPTLNLSLNRAGIMGSIDNQIKMSYSIDGIKIGTVPLKNNEEVHIISTAVGIVNLPKLSDGQHILTIELYGLEYPYHPKQYSWYENTVYFSIYNDSTLNQSTTPTPSPTAPEFPAIVLLSMLVLVLVSVVAVKLKKQANKS